MHFPGAARPGNVAHFAAIDMINRILTVGGYTLLSRITGFIRDIMLEA